MVQETRRGKPFQRPPLDACLDRAVDGPRAPRPRSPTQAGRLPRRRRRVKPAESSIEHRHARGCIPELADEVVCLRPQQQVRSMTRHRSVEARLARPTRSAERRTSVRRPARCEGYTRPPATPAGCARRSRAKTREIQPEAAVSIAHVGDIVDGSRIELDPGVGHPRIIHGRVRSDDKFCVHPSAAQQEPQQQ